MLARTPPDDRQARRVRGKLLRYLIRMSTRPTPYGLFAGVGLVGWGAETDVTLAAEPPRTRTRADMEWLLDLVTSLERDPKVRLGLRLVANSAVTLRGGRAFARSDSGPVVSVRATGAVRRALELARVPISQTVLVEALSSAPGATPEKVQRLIDELWRRGLLLSDLRPPLTGPDPASHVRERLAGIPAAEAVANGLAELRDALAAWDGLPFEEREGAWSSLLNRVRSLHPTEASANLLQTDMALPLVGAHVHAAVGEEATRAADLLLRLSPFPDGPPHLDAYRQAFAARYGPDREVPLLELIDPDFGLGPPGNRVGDHFDHQVGASQQLLRDLALDAHRNRRLVVELDDELLGDSRRGRRMQPPPRPRWISRCSWPRRRPRPSTPGTFRLWSGLISARARRTEPRSLRRPAGTSGAGGARGSRQRRGSPRPWMRPRRDRLHTAASAFSQRRHPPQRSRPGDRDRYAARRRGRACRASERVGCRIAGWTLCRPLPRTECRGRRSPGAYAQSAAVACGGSLSPRRRGRRPLPARSG